MRHVVAMTKGGQLFIWDDGSHGCLGHNNSGGKELLPKRVEHGGFAELFIVCVATGCSHLAVIDSFGLVPIPLFFSIVLDSSRLAPILLFFSIVLDIATL